MYSISHLHTSWTTSTVFRNPIYVYNYYTLWKPVVVAEEGGIFGLALIKRSIARIRVTCSGVLRLFLTISCARDGGEPIAVSRVGARGTFALSISSQIYILHPPSQSNLKEEGLCYWNMSLACRSVSMDIFELHHSGES